MKEIAEKVKPGWQLPRSVRDEFSEFCADHGAIAQDECAGAILLWQRMPATIRDWAKMEAKGQPMTPAGFWDAFQEALADASLEVEREMRDLEKRGKPKSK